MADPQAPLPRQLAWFVGLWAAGVVVVSAVGLLLRSWLMG